MTIALLHGVAPPATAHAFGSFSISVASGLIVTSQGIRVRWVMDMADVAASATVGLMDADGDGSVTGSEKDTYFRVWAGSLVGNLQLIVDGQELPLTVLSSELTLPDDESGNPALRLAMDLVAPMSAEAAGVHQASYQDTNYREFVGWREVYVAAGTGAQLIESSVPVEGRTRELTVYPADLGLSVPVDEARFAFSLGTLDASSPEPSRAPSPAPSVVGEPTGLSFSIWPTGVLAGLMLVLLAIAVRVSNRSDRSGPT